MDGRGKLSPKGFCLASSLAAAMLNLTEVDARVNVSV